MPFTGTENFPVFRAASVVLAGAVLVGLAVRGLQQELSTSDERSLSQLHSSGYGCPEDAPLPESDDRPLQDVTEAVGLGFTHTVGPPGTWYVPESVGSGAAWCDLNNDGWLDLFLVNGERSPGAEGEFPAGTTTRWAVYAGNPDGGFTDVSEKAGLDGYGFGMGVAAGDLDNDGDVDLYVTCVRQDRLLLNEGDFRFREVAVAAGIEESEWGTGVSFFDFDRDGFLDIVVANYTRDDEHDHQISCGFQRGLTSYCGPHKFAPTVDRLYRNEGLHSDPGQPLSQLRFSDVTESAGLADVTSYGFSVVASDVNEDGWPDMLIANDSQPDRLWINQQNGTFAERATEFGLALNAAGSALGSMGIAKGDLDRDLKSDFVISTLSTESTTLLRSFGEGGFVDSTQLFGLNRFTLPHTGWGIALVDLNHDGWLDMPLVNGLVIPCRSRFAPHGEDAFLKRRMRIDDHRAYWADYADRNLLIMFRGELPLLNETVESGGDFTRAEGSGRCLLCGDPDNDGDMDLLVSYSGNRARLYRNEFPKEGHWIRFRLTDPGRRRDALGAKIMIECGNEKWVSELIPQSSFLASHDPRVHFGLGNHSQVDRITVYWPDGPVEDSAEQFTGFPADADYVIERGTGIRMKVNP